MELAKRMEESQCAIWKAVRERMEDVQARRGDEKARWERKRRFVARRRGGRNDTRQR